MNQWDRLALIFTLILGLTAVTNISAREMNHKALNPINKKILVLVVASDDAPVYLELQKVWRAYMHSDPDHVEAYFIKSDPSLATPCEIKGDVIYGRSPDNYNPGMLTKTLLAMRRMTPRLSEFDYVIRTNLSSFYVWTRLFTFLETLPKMKCYCAHIDRDPNNFVPSWGCGAGLILSPDMVKLLVRKQYELLRHPLAQTANEDLIIASFFQSKKIELLSAPRLDVLTPALWNANREKIPEGAFHFRVKNSKPARRLSDDIYVHSELLKMFYGIEYAN